MSDENFDCIIAGGGHAGCEASIALAKLGLKTLLISSNLDRLGYLSCNPAIGGLAKGHLVREIDALGGQMGLWADAAAIQYRTLNMSKGPAVRATRAQMDRNAYQNAVKCTLYNTKDLTLWQDEVTELLTQNGQITGVKTAFGRTFYCAHVLLTTGTFLEGKIHIGQFNTPAGRMGDKASIGLSSSLKKVGHKIGRLKTGTTPRILTSSINFDVLEIQPPELDCPGFSFHGPGPKLPQQPCYITFTNEETHKVIRSGFDRSPLFTGVIEGTGARYCPSIEDKVARFPHRDRHQIFLEPEGLDSGEMYANGISTSLPLDIQKAMVKTIKGLENAVMARPGYAIEYDFSNPMQLWPTLESKHCKGLWLAGQINGTSGYEEAAAQGLWAALNIAAKHKGESPFLPARHEAYMAVLIDDLVTLGTEEPYRMFTSRAEHRLLLREDNAEDRLSDYGYKAGLISEEQWHKICKDRKSANIILNKLRSTRMPGVQKTAAEYLQRPDVSLEDAINNLEDKQELFKCLAACHIRTRNNIESNIKYSGYMERQTYIAQRSAKLASVALPLDLDYTKVIGLSNEAREKLLVTRPLNLGQAARISGITPAALGCIEVYLHKLGLI